MVAIEELYAARRAAEVAAHRVELLRQAADETRDALAETVHRLRMAERGVGGSASVMQRRLDRLTVVEPAPLGIAADRVWLALIESKAKIEALDQSGPVV